MVIFQSLSVNRTLTNQIVKVFMFNNSGGKKEGGMECFLQLKLRQKLKRQFTSAHYK